MPKIELLNFRMFDPNYYLGSREERAVAGMLYFLCIIFVFSALGDRQASLAVEHRL